MEQIALRVLNLFFYLRYPRQLLRFRRKAGYWPDIAVPRRYHEKLLWRRLVDRNPQFRVFCDKLAAKAFVAERCPDMAIPETLWVGVNPDDIPAAILAGSAAIKTSHACDQNIFIRDGKVDRKELNRTLRGWLARGYGGRNHEWGYFGLPRRLLAEELLEGSTPLVDVTVRCGDGRAILAAAITGNKTRAKRSGYFTLEGERLDFDIHDANTGQLLPTALPADFVMPECFGEAVRAAEMLSRGVDYLRCDFMVVDGRLYAGELTVYPAGGIGSTDDDQPDGLDRRLAAAWNLRRSWFLTEPQRGWRAAYARALRRRIDATEDVTEPEI